MVKTLQSSSPTSTKTLPDSKPLLLAIPASILTNKDLTLNKTPVNQRFLKEAPSYVSFVNRNSCSLDREP